MIYTGKFSEIKIYEKAGLTPVSIAGKAPNTYKGVQFKILAPKYSWWKEWHDNHLSNDWYKAKYQETVLNMLDPRIIAQKLQVLGNNVVLLCYEDSEEFCHRHLVSQWLEGAGISACEYTPL